MKCSTRLNGAIALRSCVPFVLSAARFLRLRHCALEDILPHDVGAFCLSVERCLPLHPPSAYAGTVNSVECQTRLTYLQRYIANVAITPSVFRNSAPKGSVKKAIDFLSTIDLKPLKNLEPSDYPEWLDNRTEELRKRLADLWGPARKAINIFMTMALLNRFISSAYRLNRLKAAFEVPLDGRVRNKLVVWGKQQKIIRRGELPPFSIRALKKKDSDRYQELAQRMAAERKIPRGLLDVELWGNP